jgi:hypothetical protein
LIDSNRGGAPILTAGREIRVPVDAQLHFRLDRPLELREALQ